MIALPAFVVFLPLVGFYVLLSWGSGAHEMIVAVAVSSLSALFFVVAHRERARDPLVRPPIRALSAPVPRLATESWRVGRVLLRVLVARRRPDGPVGAVASQPFREGGRDRRDAGRRGLVVLSASVTPNGFALHLPEGRDRIVMHRPAPEPPDPDREWPA